MLRQEQKEYELNRNLEVFSQKVPLAFFDIDGTLAEGFAIFSFAEYLSARGLFRQGSWEEMQVDFEVYRAGDRGEKSYRKFAIGLVNHYAQGLKRQTVEEIENQSEMFFKEVQGGRLEKYKLFEYTEELVELMRGIGKTVAVSGSPVEPLLPLKRFLSFDELRATTLRIANGYFTGQVANNLAIGVAKNKVVGEYLKDGIDIERSFAFGDSLHDVPILEAVGNPFVLGSNEGLQELGRSRGWFVISDGDEIIEVVKNQINLLFDEE